MALTATFAADMSAFLKSLGDAQVKLQVFDKATKTSFRDLNRVVGSFSGQKIAVEAARVAEAVQRIGGASRLTDSEQRRVNATMTEAIAKYRALGQEAPAVLQKLAAETAKVESATKGLGGALGAALAGGVAGGVAAVSSAAIAGAQQIASLATRGVGELVKRGGEVAAMSGAFVRLSGGVTQADQAVGKMRSSTKGLIADFDLMQASNKALLLGLGLNDGELADLAKTATTLGRAMGQDATKSLDDLITALGRSSPMILDNLGLSVKVGEANEQYARKVGKTADALTDAEKKQAFMTAAMEAARVKVGQLGEVQLTLTERVQQAGIWFSNLFDKVSAGVVQSSVLSAGFDAIQKALGDAFGTDQAQLVDTIVKAVDVFAIQVVKGAEQLVNFADVGAKAFGLVMTPIRAATVAAVGLGEGFARTVAGIAELGAKLPGAGSSMQGIADAARQQADQFTTARTGAQKLLSDSINLAKGQGAVHEGLAATREALHRVATSMEEAAAAGPKAGAGGDAAAGGIKKAGAAAGEADPKLKAYLQSLRELSGRQALDDAAKAVKQLGDIGGPLKVLPSQLEEFRKRLELGAEAALHLGDVKLSERFQELREKLKPVILLQEKWHVTVRDLAITNEDFSQVVREQIDVLTKLDDTLYFGILPNIGKLAEAWVPFKAAVESAMPGFKAAANELEILQAAAARRALVDSLRGLSSAFADLAESTGRTDGPLAKIAELIGLMGIGATAGLQFGDALRKMQDDGKASAAGILQMAGATVAAIAAIAHATDKAGAGSRALGGAAVGAQFGLQAGAAIGAAFGPGGAAIGAAIGGISGGLLGGLTGLLRKPAFADIMHRVGRDWGVQISEGLARGIALDASKLFSGNRQAAEIFNLDKIIGEAGGLTSDNLDEMASHLRDVFVMLQKGSFTSAQAIQVLDKNWRAFVEAGTDATGRLAPALTEIIRLTREAGLASKEVAAYQREQASSALEGLNAVIGALGKDFEGFQKIADSIKSAQGDIDKLNETPMRGRGADWMKDMDEAQKRLKELQAEQHNAAMANKEDLELFGQIAVGVYGAAIEAGLTHSQALKAAQPGLEQLVTAYQNLGLSAEDAGLKQLLAQAQILKNNPTLLAGIDGLAQSFTALSNMGLLNVDTFQKMQRAGLVMFDKLKAEVEKTGLTGEEAARATLVPMQAYLHAAAKQAELLGIPLDEATQKLIDQSKELGIWKDEGKDDVETMKDAIHEMTDSFKEFLDELKKLPSQIRTNVHTSYTSEGEPPPDRSNPAPRDPSQWPDYHNPNPGGFERGPSYRVGSNGIQDFGAETWARLHGRERVQTEAQMVLERLRLTQRQPSGGGEFVMVPVFLSNNQSPDQIVEAVFKQLPTRVAFDSYGARTKLRKLITESTS